VGSEYSFNAGKHYDESREQRLRCLHLRVPRMDFGSSALWQAYIQEWAMITDVMKLILKYIEEDLIRTPVGSRRKFLVRAGLFFGLSFLGGLRGEEVPRIVRKDFIALNKVSLARANLPHIIQE
jgi:hypothetical protein